MQLKGRWWRWFYWYSGLGYPYRLSYPSEESLTQLFDLTHRSTLIQSFWFCMMISHNLSVRIRWCMLGVYLKSGLILCELKKFMLLFRNKIVDHWVDLAYSYIILRFARRIDFLIPNISLALAINEVNGNWTMVFVLDLQSPDMIPANAEPLFQGHEVNVKYILQWISMIWWRRFHVFKDNRTSSKNYFCFSIYPEHFKRIREGAQASLFIKLSNFGKHQTAHNQLVIFPADSKLLAWAGTAMGIIPMDPLTSIVNMAIESICMLCCLSNILIWIYLETKCTLKETWLPLYHPELKAEVSFQVNSYYSSS